MKNKIQKLKRKALKISISAKMAGMSDNDIANSIRVASREFLDSKEWKSLRLLAIDKYGLVCLCCGRSNSRKFPINIDHIKPRKLFPELALNIDNLQPLCGPCNKRKGNFDFTDYRNNLNEIDLIDQENANHIKSILHDL